MKDRITAGLLILFTLNLIACNAANKQTASKLAPSEAFNPKHIVDTHIHLYDTSREGGVPWPKPKDKVLYQPYLPERYAKSIAGTGLTATVIVEASTIYSDNQWMLDLIKGNDHFIGLVGHLDLTQPTASFTSKLKALTKDKDRTCKYVGIRLRSSKKYTLENEVLIQNLKTLAKHDLALDMLANGQDVAGVNRIIAMAEKLPALRIVANHMIGRNVDGKPVDQAWIDAAGKLATYKNVWVKVSGLYQRSTIQPAPKDINHYKPVLDVLFKHYGPDRLVYGSNWPCTEISGDYTSFITLVRSYMKDLSPEVQEKFYWQNANEVYRLGLK